MGSGNSGASNAGRLFGVLYFFLVLFIDAGKAWGLLYFLQTQYLSLFLQEMSFFMLLVCAETMLIGNSYSCFLSFKGGKGVATTLGIFLNIYSWWASLFFMLVWLSVALVTKKASLASLCALIHTVLLLAGWLILTQPRLIHVPHIIFLVSIAIFIIWRHWPLTNVTYDQSSSVS